jgi:adenylate cyclase
VSNLHTDQRLAAILAADVAGYSRLMEADERATVATLDAYRAVFRERVAGHGGRVVDTAGDSVLAVLPSAIGAFEAATEIQDELRGRNERLPEDQRMHFRIGVNLGDVIEKEDGSIYGSGVNVAARLESLAEPGGICLSGSAHDQVEGKMDAQFVDGGLHEVKNIARPLQVWRWAEAPISTASGAAAATDAPTLPDKPSIVVLPFENITGEKEQDYFADGLTEEVTTELSRFSGLFVIARNTAETFKGQAIDIRDVATQLGVHFVLEGSVRKSGDQVRIAAQLIDGREGDHLWAERYDGTLEDVFALQEEVTRQVVASIGVEITQAEQSRIGRGERIFDKASDLAWQSGKLCQESLHRGDANLMEEAIALADRAQQVNPDCLLAYSWLTLQCMARQLYGWGQDSAANRALAERAGKELMARAPRDYMTYFSRGLVETMYGRFDSALANLKRAFDLNRNDVMPIFALAYTEARVGDVENAKAHAHLAMRLSPKDRWIGTAHLALAMSAFVGRDYATARQWAELAIQSHPTAPIRRALMIACGAEAGDDGLVREHLKYLMSFAPDFIPSMFRGENPIFRRPEHMGLFLDGLRKAGTDVPDEPSAPE